MITRHKILAALTALLNGRMSGCWVCIRSYKGDEDEVKLWFPSAFDDAEARGEDGSAAFRRYFEPIHGKPALDRAIAARELQDRQRERQLDERAAALDRKYADADAAALAPTIPPAVVGSNGNGHAKKNGKVPKAKAAPTPAPTTTPPESDTSTAFCADDVLLLLEGQRERMSVDEMATEFKRLGEFPPYSTADVRQACDALLKAGSLDEGADERGTGFGLASWKMAEVVA